MQDREQKMFEAACEIEKDFELLGREFNYYKHEVQIKYYCRFKKNFFIFN